MEIKRIEGANKFHGAPENWNETQHGLCGALPTVDMVVNNVPFMVSAHEPTPDELDLLNRGAPIYLGVSALKHPVVFLSVGEAADGAEEDEIATLKRRFSQALSAIIENRGSMAAVIAAKEFSLGLREFAAASTWGTT